MRAGRSGRDLGSPLDLAIASSRARPVLCKWWRRRATLYWPILLVEDEPLPVVTREDEPVVAEGGDGAARPVDEVAGVRVAGEHGAFAEPVLVPGDGDGFLGESPVGDEHRPGVCVEAVDVEPAEGERDPVDALAAAGEPVGADPKQVPLARRRGTMRAAITAQLSRTLSG